MPVHCGLLCASREAAVNALTGDIRLGFCHACGMIYNLSFDPCRVQYSQGYDNSLHFSPHFQRYSHALASRLIETYELRAKHIIEIGCGHGDFLSLLCELGQNTGLGFDPSYAAAQQQHTAGQVTIVRDDYAAHYASYETDLICCRQVLEHIHHPTVFLQRLRRTIGNRVHVPVFFEVPNGLCILQGLSVWDIIYEHCSYFTTGSLRYLFEACGFEIRDIYETYDGQYLCIEALPGQQSGADQRIRGSDLSSVSHAVAMFTENYRHRIALWQRRLAHIEQAGRRAVVWGAGAKGLSFMNMLQCQEHIQYVVDINPRKQGMYLAGGGQQIVAPAFLRAYRPDMVIVMNPIYMQEIGQIVQSLGVNSELIPA
jgi:SAM-dependent methyltransferase